MGDDVKEAIEVDRKNFVLCLLGVLIQQDEEKQDKYVLCTKLGWYLEHELCKLLEVFSDLNPRGGLSEVDRLLFLVPANWLALLGQGCHFKEGIKLLKKGITFLDSFLQEAKPRVGGLWVTQDLERFCSYHPFQVECQFVSPPTISGQLQ